MPRCPNGTRKNRKTGNCEPNSTCRLRRKAQLKHEKKQLPKK